MIRGVVDQTVEQIIRDRGISKGQAYELRRNATAEVSSAGASHSLAQKILQVLKNGPVKDLDELRQALFFKEEDLLASHAEISKAVWSLQKRSLVTFYERKTGKGDSLLTRIKLTRNGLKEMGVIATREHIAPSKVQPSRELKRPSKVGKDMTDEQQHKPYTNGGEVEVIGRKEAPEVIESVPYVAPPAPEPARYAAPEPLPANQKPDVPRDLLADCPEIRALQARASQRGRLEMAAEVLIEQNEIAAAERLMQRAQFTALEEEVLRLVSRL